jgi:hypothetical protein
MSMPAIDINAMEPEVRLRLIGGLWDSLSESPEDISLTPLSAQFVPAVDAVIEDELLIVGRLR